MKKVKSCSKGNPLLQTKFIIEELRCTDFVICRKVAGTAISLISIYIYIYEVKRKREKEKEKGKNNWKTHKDID